MFSKSILCGSYSDHPVGSTPIPQPVQDPGQITVVIRRKGLAPRAATLESRVNHDDFADLYGADPDDIQAVERFASRVGLSVLNVNPAARTVTLSGPASTLAEAFGAEVETRKVGESILRTRRGNLYLPEELDGRIIAILGHDQRPVAATYHQFRPHSQQAISYTPTQLAKIYNFPTNIGTNQTIAMIELGGGFTDADLQTYWKQIGVPAVSTAAVSVDGAANSPTGDPNGPDGEVMLDIEVAGGVAPGAHIAVYFAPNTDQGFLGAINAAIHDKVRKPSVISISWGAPESQWTAQAMNAFNAAFHDAALLGISVCVASGDNGSSDGLNDSAPHVDFPASSPWVLACGGTNLVANGNAIQSETVWNDGVMGGATGGGVSSHFSRPAYQSAVHVPTPSGTANTTGRGVPDVAGVADPETGYQILVDGQTGIIGGTSAVAPLWAGLIALCNEQLGRNLGWFHPALYGTITQHKALHDITSGTNGVYRAGIGWDACTGLGTPNGLAILNVLKTLKK